MLGSRAWGPWAALCTGVPRGARAALGCCTLRRAVLGPWDCGLIAVGSSPQQAYSVTLSPHPSRCGRWGRGGFPSPFFLGPLQNLWPRPPGQAPEPSVQTRQQVAGRLRTGPAGVPGNAREPPAQLQRLLGAEAGAGVSCGNPADGKSPAAGPQAATLTPPARGGTAGPTASCFPLMSPMGGSAPPRQRGHTLAGLQPAVPLGPGYAGVRQGTHGRRVGPEAGWKNPGVGRELRRRAQGREGLQAP